jgi:ABC-2 type transport system permease protein
MKQALVIARKELSAYFGSLMALIFLGTFLVVTLAVFFSVEKFFDRNIADVRLLFRWMPLLLLFLVAALTMRQWSEEQRAGTLEVLLTLPVRRVELVLGKFLAVMGLVAVALALTLFLPITVSLLGNLDWGPVLGGYLAALLMASAYAALGLFVSSRTDNQIVSLIVTVILGGLLYVVGTSFATTQVGETLANILRAIGTGSRFESIERGVIDLRDLIYYLSLTALFLLLNIVSLDARRWSRGPQTTAYRRQVLFTVALVAANLVALNTWLFPLGGLRADLTADREYSLSPVTKDLIRNLPEPLLIRGYFSEKTHPLLAPLVPTIRDLLREYQIASGGKIQVEIVDPHTNEEIEAEANQVYGIQPTPFRVQGQYESAIINSYFDILIRYGDQHVVLNFSDLIEVEQSPGTGDVEVRLRNLEYDLTRSIKKVVYGFQSLDAVFASIQDPIQLTAIITPDSLPESLQQVPERIATVAQQLETESGGKFQYKEINPDDPNSSISRQDLIQGLNLYPISTSLFSQDSYYLDLMLQIGDQTQLFYPSGDLSEAEIRTEIESALKRAAPGFLKTVGLWTPPTTPQPDPFGNVSQPIWSWDDLQSQLSQDYTVEQVDLSTGRVPGDVDVLLLVAPQGMTDKERFAIDQFLMRGGSVIVLAGNYQLAAQQYYGLTIEPLADGLQDMLASYGVTISSTLVMDPQNEPFPVQVPRTVGGMQVYEIQQMDYPLFVDVRNDGMANNSVIVSDLPAVTLQWASPVKVDTTQESGREVTVLLQSSDESWQSTSTDAQPNPDLYPDYGFAVEGEQARLPLAVSIHGSFDSYFKDKPFPFDTQIVTDTTTAPVGTVEVSPDSARLVVIGSSEFVDDAVLNISQQLSADRYLYNLQLVHNAVDWSVEDEDLLTIRSRGTYAHLLNPLEDVQKARAMWINYGLAVLAVAAIGVVGIVRRRNEEPMVLVDEAELQKRESDLKEGGDDE